MTNTVRELIYLLSLPALLSGCSIDASIINLGESIAVMSKTSNEIVPASQQLVVTRDKYRVQSSISYYQGKSDIQTSKGYRVQISVQSMMYKE